jgi:hypothetical protein
MQPAAGLVALASFAASAAGQEELYHVEGASPGSNFGLELAVAGDVDLDGALDFLAGAPADGGSDAGRAALHSGVAGALLFEWFGAASGDMFGAGVAGAGDVTGGDGIPDVLVGALRATDPSSGRLTGAVSLYSGADGSHVRTLYGGFDGEEFGASNANVGDVDGDGVDDHVIGAPRADYVQQDGGAAYLYSGASGGFLGRIDGPGKDNLLGGAVAAMGDVDLDGAGDFAVGLPHRNANGLRNSGAAWVYSGKSLTRLFVVAGDQVDLNLGWSIAGGTDLSGDAIGDLLVGAPLWTGAFAQQGAVRAYSGVDGSLLWELLGTKSNDHLGAAMDAADSDGDGHLELLVSAGQQGDARWRVELRRADTSLLHAWRGPMLDDGLGTRLALLGDVSGDGLADFATSAPRADDGSSTFEGFVYVYAGSDLWLNADPKEVAGGQTLSTTTRIGVPGNSMLRFVVDVSGTPLFLPLLPLATFDPAGAVVHADVVPSGLSGLTVTLRVYAIGPGGKLVDTNDETVELL